MDLSVTWVQASVWLADSVTNALKNRNGLKWARTKLELSDM